MRHFTPLALSLATALAGCEAGTIVTPYDTGASTEEEDIALKAAAADCADGPTLKGLDVSKWQPTINWDAVRDSGVDFVFIRAAYGSTVDPYFKQHWQGARNAGLLVGAYQYVLAGQNVDAQVNAMLATVGTLGPDDLPMVIDVEEGGNAGVSRATWRAFITTWTTRVKASSGKTPIIYTGGPYWTTNVGDSSFGAAHALWEPRYSATACPDVPAGWKRWSFWQYTDKGQTPGIAGNTDRNYFNGTIDDLLALAHADVPPVETPPPPPPPTPPPTPPPPAASYYKVCNATWLNQRSGPSTGYSVLRSLAAGTRVKGLDTQNGWIKNDANGKIGWSKATYLCPSS